MAYDTGNLLRGPVLMLHESIIDNATRSVDRVKKVAEFNSGNVSHVSTSDMKRLRGDVLEAKRLVERQERDETLHIPSPVIDGLPSALLQAKELLSNPEMRPVLDKAYAPQFVQETVRQIDEAYTEIDRKLNPPKVKWEETRSGDLQAAMEF